MRRTLFIPLFSWLLAVLLLYPAAALAEVPFALIAKNKIKLEVAQSEAQIEHGLMERASMPEDQGMVFLFRPPRQVRFWMFDCLMSLDMIFIKDGKILKICRDVPPYKGTVRSEAPLYPDEGSIEASEVIEVNAGYCSRHGIKDGDSVRFDFAGNLKLNEKQEKEPAATPRQTGK